WAARSFVFTESSRDEVRYCDRERTPVAQRSRSGYEDRDMHRIALMAALLALGVSTLSAPASAQSRGVHGRRLLIGVSFSSELDHHIADAAREAFEQTLRGRVEVVVHEGDARSAQHAMRTQHLRGHFFQANLRATPARRGALRIAVTIVVSTLE